MNSISFVLESNCYNISGNNLAVDSILSGANTKLVDNSPEKCSQFCEKSNFAYAGVQYNKCFCGNQMPSASQRSFGCYSVCPGDNLEQCGGFTVMNVYKVKGMMNYSLRQYI